MVDLFSYRDPSEHAYARLYEAFSQLRERFHQSGRLDDSNAKLDEVTKLFATYLAFKTGKIGRFPSAESTSLISELESAFVETVQLPQYHLDGGRSIFGSQPGLSIRSGDEEMASDLVRMVQQSVDLAFQLQADDRPFDILNEAFGHFVRDNFRSNIEDAQYMTPPEVTDFMADIVLQDLIIENSLADDTGRSYTILDPSCGVGSFLGAVYRRAKTSKCLDHRRLRLFGQDKVERMVRLSTLNLELFDVEEHRITLGNSLEIGSPLDDLNGNADIILTNPPFGARFGQEYVDTVCRDNTPFFSSRRRAAASIDSELLFIDRGLRLLKKGGHMLIIVPDGVVSAKGMSALLRQYLRQAATLRAVVELPPTTFAQAGTRTKTAILHLQKGRAGSEAPVFMGVSSDIGFQVSSRKGIQIKMPRGENELLAIASAYREARRRPVLDQTHVVSVNPSCVTVPEPVVFRGTWSPKQYSAERYEAIEKITSHGDFELVPLRELVEFHTSTRKSARWQDGWAFISVLHIFGEGLVNVSGVLDYKPKTPGTPIYPGELLVARINPRIPRVCVTPDFGVKTLCSSEFEVMAGNGQVDTYELAYMLQTSSVRSQIHSLTSGTSASHSRIRTHELGQVLIPIVKRGTQRADLVAEMVADYRTVLDSLATNATTVAKLRQREEEIFAKTS